MEQEEIDLKFWVSSHIGFDNWPDFGEGNQIKNTGDKKIAVVYQTWSTEKYIPYMYFSLLGQIMYTDVLERADIYIFVDEERYEYVRWLFRNILDSKHIIKVSRMMAVKYMITCHPTLTNYEIVTVVDSDMFFYAKENKKHDFYKRIYDNIENINAGPLMLVDNGIKASEVFWGRKKDLCTSMSDKDYVNMIMSGSNLSSNNYSMWMQRKNWPLSCIFVYSPSTFNQSNYYKYAVLNAYNYQYCDETVWISWTLGSGKNYQDFKSVTGISYYLIINDNIKERIDLSKDVALIHPLTGPNRKNEKMLEILLHIKEQFKLNGKK